MDVRGFMGGPALSYQGVYKLMEVWNLNTKQLSLEHLSIEQGLFKQSLGNVRFSVKNLD